MLRVFNGEALCVKRDRPLVIRDNSSLTEQVGYVTIEQQVMAMMISGERLQSFKRQAYDCPDGEFDEDVIKPDPTLDVGFDMADYSYYQSELAKKISAAKKIKKSEGVSQGKSGEGVPSSSSDAPEVKE